MNFHGQKRATVENSGVVPLPEEVSHVVGVTATVLESPPYSRHMVLVAEAGDWRLKTGSHPSLAATTPMASITDGTGSLLLKEGDQLVIPAPAEITVVGPDSGSILTYFWA